MVEPPASFLTPVYNCFSTISGLKIRSPPAKCCTIQHWITVTFCLKKTLNFSVGEKVGAFPRNYLVCLPNFQVIGQIFWVIAL